MNRSQGNNNHLGRQVLQGYYRYSKESKEQPMRVRRNCKKNINRCTNGTHTSIGENRNKTKTKHKVGRSWSGWWARGNRLVLKLLYKEIFTAYIYLCCTYWNTILRNLLHIHKLRKNVQVIVQLGTTSVTARRWRRVGSKLWVRATSSIRQLPVRVCIQFLMMQFVITRR